MAIRRTRLLNTLGQCCLTACALWHGLAMASWRTPSLDPDFEKVTLGSTLKLTHQATGYKLHSHEVKYGTGSGQQSVTAFPESDDPNSLWLVEGARQDDRPVRGRAVKCGETVRLRHTATQAYLHSHAHRAPLSGHQEVSAFAPPGDAGDHWRVTCLDAGGRGGAVWRREAGVRLVHVETGWWLASGKGLVYPRPIPGQLEVHARPQPTDDAVWVAMEGFYFSALEEETTQGQKEEQERDEL